MDARHYPPHMAELEKGYKLVYGKIHEQLKRKWFQYTVLFFIVGSIASIIYSSFEISAPFRTQLFLFNYVASFVFTIEYALRLISAPMQYPDKRGWQARLKYIFSFYGIIDFVAILPFVVIYTYQNSPHLHLVVLAYILIIFKLIRYSRSFRLIGEVLHAVREELVTAYTACGIMLGFSGILGFWWAIVAFTTVGYGDIYPITPLGRLLSSLISLIGIAMIAIPTGIISSAFMNMMLDKRKEREEKDKEKTDSKNNL